MVEVYLFLLGYLLQLAAGVSMGWQVVKLRSVYGLAPDTYICLFLSTAARCFWARQSRLTDSVVLYAELAASTVMFFVLAWNVWKFRHTTTKAAPTYLRYYSLVPMAAIGGILFHPGPTYNMHQMLVAFSMFLEAFSLLPQLSLMRSMVEVEPMTSQFVALVALSRIVRVCFWIYLAVHRGEIFVALIFSDVLHTVLAGDYVYVWLRKLKSGPALDDEKLTYRS